MATPVRPRVAPARVSEFRTGRLRRTLTWDQGKELAPNQKVTERIETRVFFRDAHSPWQRGTNENMNGLLRDYVPKDTNLQALTPAETPAGRRRRECPTSQAWAGPGPRSSSPPRGRAASRNDQLSLAHHQTEQPGLDAVVETRSGRGLTARLGFSRVSRSRRVDRRGRCPRCPRRAPASGRAGRSWSRRGSAARSSAA